MKYQRIFPNLQNRNIRNFGLFLLFFLILLLRRSAQLFHPQVWDEDGAVVLPGLINHGLLSLAQPVANAYLITIAKLIDALALSISGLHFPFISTLITWTFDSLVCVAICVCPTWLRGGVWLGVLTLLIPSDPEVFGVPLYSFWWASLLLFVVALWDENSQDVKWRAAFVLLAGLSSPIIFVVTPLLFVRTALLKNKRESAILVCALICCTLQLMAMHRYPGAEIGTGNIDLYGLRLIVPKFLGWYLLGNISERAWALWIAGLIVIAFVGVTSWRHLRERSRLVLMALWLGTVLLAVTRVDLSFLNPRLGGPRYFFFPFVLLSWYVVTVFAGAQGRKLKGLAAAMMLLSIVNAVPVLSRTQNDFRWAEHIASCSRFENYSILLSFDGNLACSLDVNKKQCRSLQNAGLLSSVNHFEKAKSYPYTAKALSPENLSTSTFATISALSENRWNGSDIAKSTLPGFVVIGSFRTGEADVGAISVKLHKGDKVLFRSGGGVKQRVAIAGSDAFLDLPPAGPIVSALDFSWTILEFSNDLLPDEFTVTFGDHGIWPGEWSAIALRK